MNNQSTSADRRVTDRAAITVAVRKTIGDRVYLCQSGDISPTGMLVAKVYEGMFNKLPKCWLSFTLPHSEVEIRARGQVVRQQHKERFHLLGVQFGTLAPSHRRLIEDYLRGPLFSAARTASPIPLAG